VRSSATIGFPGADRDATTPVPNHQPNASKSQQESKYIWDGLMINGILALATLVLAIVGICQARAATAGARAAQASADAAKDNARTAERAFYTTSRPWVLVSDFEIGPSVLGPVITYKIYNAGPTPAILSGVVIRADVSTLQPTLYHEYLEPTATRVIAIHVPPHSDATNGFFLQEFRPTVSDANRRDMQTGAKWLYCYGLVRYRGPMNKEWLYETGFGYSHQGDCSSFPVKMQPMIDPKVNYVH
jgi:hypothetical protein